MGYIYIFTNSDHPDMVKIGYSDSWKQRLKNANNETNNLATISCYATYEVQQRLADKIFFDIIEILNPSSRFVKERPDSKDKVTEWFSLSKENAYRIFEVIAEISGTQNRLVLVGEKDEKKKTKSNSKNKAATSSTESKKQIASGTIHDTKTIPVEEFNEIDALSTYPVSFVMMGVEHELVKPKWRQALIGIINILYDTDPSIILSLVNIPFSLSGKEVKKGQRAYITNDVGTIEYLESKKLAYYAIPNTSICFYVNFDSVDTFRFIRILVEKYGMDFCKCSITLVPNTGTKQIN